MSDAEPALPTSSQTVLSQAPQEHSLCTAVLITDKLKSYAAAKVQIMSGVEHRQHNGLNNRAEQSHQPTRQRSGKYVDLGHHAMFWRHIVRSIMPSLSAQPLVGTGVPAYPYSNILTLG
jgi:transposase-like protein